MSNQKKENKVVEPSDSNAGNPSPKKTFAEFELNKEWVTKSLPVILVLAAVATFYIFLVHAHVKTLSKIENLKTENQELRSELIAIQTDLMTKSKQSEVANRVKESGLKEMREPPLQLKKEKKK